MPVNSTDVFPTMFKYPFKERERKKQITFTFLTIKKRQNFRLKQIADNKLNVAKLIIFLTEKVEKHSGKKINCWSSAFFPFLTMFRKASSSGSLKVGTVWEKVQCFTCLVMFSDQSVNSSQNDNTFKLVQDEGICK